VHRRLADLPQYVSIKYTERLTEAGVEPSVGSVGDSYGALANAEGSIIPEPVSSDRWQVTENRPFPTL
jgi:putative transposase